MEKQYEKKITWTIKNFASFPSEKICSDQFVVGASKWHLVAYPKGCVDLVKEGLAVFLKVSDSESLPCGWKRRAKFFFAIINQNPEKVCTNKVSQIIFNHYCRSYGTHNIIPLRKLMDINGGFLVNGEVKIVVEINVIEVIGKSDVLEETFLVDESIDVNGFQVRPSQVESVNNLFKEHPDIASKFLLKNKRLRTANLDSLLSLTEILKQSPKELSINDLNNAYSTLTYLTTSGFQLDWLELKLKEVGKNRVLEIEEELKDFKQKCSDMEVLLEFFQKIV